MAITEVSIANSALIKIGADRITALSDDNKRAILCNEQFAKLRDEVLQAHLWNFAMARIEIAADATAPAFEYEKRFLLPSDVLRVFFVYPMEDEIEWKREGQYILSNEASMQIVYIKKIEDTSLFSPIFAECLALRLAQELAYPIVQSTQISGLMEQKYQDFLRKARSYDAQEGTPYSLTNDIFLRARY
jgi:hypothetical protein